MHAIIRGLTISINSKLCYCLIIKSLFFLPVPKLKLSSVVTNEAFFHVKTDILRVNDHSTHDGVTTQTHTEYNLEESDFVRVLCKTSKGEM
jgi:hypothetical protein